MDDFADEYVAGRTPNPCVLCNIWLKFGKLWDYGKQAGADYVATGHYARVEVAGDGTTRVARATDRHKDQSYVLSGLPATLLPKVLFPVGGYGVTFLDNLYHLILPALSVALYTSAIILRNLRASLIEVLDADYVQFARAKGLSPRIIMTRHVLRNAMVSTVTLLGLSIGNLMSGTLVTETVFAVPGVGRLMLEAIFARDYPLIQGLTLTFAVLVSVVFLLTDVVQSWLDPRLRQS